MSEFKKIENAAIIDATYFPEEVKDELAALEITTRYKNDVLGIFDWDHKNLPLTKKWLIKTYGEKIQEYKWFAILST